MWGLRPLAGLVVLGFAAGCAGSASPDAGRTLPPLPSTSHSPDAPPSPAPETKRQALRDAEAVVRRYFRVVNSLRHDMDASKLAALMTRKCTCRKQVRSVRYWATRGDHYTQRTRLIEATPAYISRGAVEVLVRFAESPGGVARRDGTYVHRTSGDKRAEQNFICTQVGRRWLIAEIQYLH